MQFGSVCSGIEAASVAWNPIGWQAAWLAEIEPFPCAVLAHHYPDVPNLGDMTTIARRVLTGEVAAPDVFCGGTPCQAFSVAGLRESLADERGNLTLKFVEIADAIDHVRTRRGDDECVIFWENVPGVLSTKDNAFGCFLGGLAGEDGPLEPPGGKWANAGAVYGPKRAVAWRLFDAQFFALAQRRRRVFVVASARKGFDPAQVLFEWDGVRRDTAPSREARQTAPTIPARSTAGGGLGTDFDCDGGLIEATTHRMVAFGEYSDDGSASAMKARDYKDATDLVAQVTHSLRGEGFDASEDGTGRGTPLVPHVVGALACNTGPNGHDAGNFACNQAVDAGHVLPVAFQETADCLTAAYGTKWNGNASATNGSLFAAQPVAYGIRTANTSSNGWGIQEEVTHTLDCAQGVAVAVALRGREGGATAELGDEVQNCLRASSGGGDKPHVLTAMQVRRLTPEECEALQGFPRSYTAIPWRGKPAEQCPDGPRYKSLGNSWAIPCVSWIGKRIQVEVARGQSD